MRLVIDTNIMVSALLKTSSVPAIAVRLAARTHIIIKSNATEHEIRAIVKRPKLLAAIDPAAAPWIDENLSKAEAVEIVDHFQGCRDVKDNKFLDLAVNGQADLIITGDADLLVLGAFRDIPIIAPVTFLRAYYPGASP